MAGITPDSTARVDLAALLKRHREGGAFPTYGELSALDDPSNRLVIMEAALQRISRWFGEFPETGKSWGDGTPTSYAAEYGSHGERDYMRQVASDAIAAPLPEQAGPSAKTDLSKRLRSFASDRDANATPFIKHQLSLAADEIERYYGGMLAWKRTAEAKDRESTAPAIPTVDRNALTDKDRLNIKLAMVHLKEAKFHTASDNLRAILGRITAAPASAPPEHIAMQEHLEKIIAAAYQIAGVHDAPAYILDVLSDPCAASERKVQDMLPYQASVRQPAVPQGWKLVPIKPTEAMMDATEVSIGGCYSCSATKPSWGECAEIYADMLAAAPEVAQPAAQVAVPDDFEDRLAAACVDCDVPDSVYESLCISLSRATQATVKTAEGL